MGEGTLKDRREGRGEEGGVVHKGHDQLGRGTTTRGGTRQSMCHPALQVRDGEEFHSRGDGGRIFFFHVSIHNSASFLVRNLLPGLLFFFTQKNI